MPNSSKAQHFRKVKYKIRGRRITFARSQGQVQFVARTALSQGQVQIVAGAALLQGQAQIWWQAQHFCKVNFRSRGLKNATFKYESSTRSQLSQLGLENRNF